jgi:radical SAM superfamily enzyme YgiQ (UPF0313 family)
MPNKIILVNPPYQYFSAKNELNYNRPPLGLLYIAASLEKNLKINVDVLDAYAENLSVTEIKAKLKNYNIIGFSVTTPTAEIVKIICQEIKQEHKSAFIFVGGPHITLCPQSLAAVADCSIIGEGEITTCAVIKNYFRGGASYNISGTLLNVNGKIIQNQPRAYCQNLDELPFPDRTKIKMNTYNHVFNYGVAPRSFTTMLTSRGCAYACHFCASQKLWGAVRRRSVLNVLAEIKQILNQGYQLLFFDDDNLMEDKKYLNELCQHILQEKLKFKWICHARIADYPPQLLQLMRQAGCVEVQIGVESYNQKALNAINKKIKAQNISACIKNFQKHKIKVWATIVLGLPEDNETSFKTTVRKLVKADPFYATFIMLFPFPGTQIYEQYKQQHLLERVDYAGYSWHDTPVFHTSELSTQQLNKLRRYAYLKFYLRPASLLKYLFAAVKYNMYKDIFLNFIRFLYFTPASRQD